MDKRKGTDNDLHNTSHKTTDRAKRTLPWIGCEFNSSGRVSKCSTRRVTFVTKPVISHILGKARIKITTNGTYPWFVVKLLKWRFQLNH
jgi:hypothetical protein